MEEISYEQFQDLTASIKRSSIHLETRDAYGTETELPHMARWAAREPDDLDWLQDWCVKVKDTSPVDVRCGESRSCRSH